MVSGRESDRDRQIDRQRYKETEIQRDIITEGQLE